MKLKDDQKILLLGILLGIACWVASSAIYSLASYDSKFIDLLTLNVPAHNYANATIFCFFFLFSLISARSYHKLLNEENKTHSALQQLKASQQELKAANQQFRAAEQQLMDANKALRLEKNKAQKYFDTVGVMMVVIDKKKKIALINKKGCSIIQAENNDITGKDWFENFVPKEKKAKAAKVFDEIIRGDTEFLEYSVGPILTATGKEHIISWHNTPIRDSEGNITSILSSGTDITYKVEARERENELRDRLTRAERMEALGILAGGVAHDLNNILTPILSLPDILIEDLNDLLEEQDTIEILEDLRSIKKSGKNASEAIKDLLTLSRRGHYEMTPLNLNNAIEAYLDSANFKELKTTKENVEFEVLLNPEIRSVLGSESHIRQAVMNLVINATESIPHDGKVCIQTNNKTVKKHEIQYETIEEGEYVVLSIKDTGEGIKEEDLAHIFEPFYTKKVMGYNSGTGLGLSVVYGVTKDHNGYIDVKTKRDKGSEFLLYLPATNSDQKTSLTKEPVERFIGNNESILVVDDMPEQRKLTKRLLKKLGYIPETAESGQEAIEMLQKAKQNNIKYDLILLDMILKDRDFDGLETYKEIIKIFPEQKCVIVSGFAETTRVLEAKKLGAGRFLNKPYSVNKISKCIHEELELK